MSDIVIVPAFEASIWVQRDPAAETAKRLEESIDSHSKTLQAYSESVNKFIELTARYGDLLARFNERVWVQHRALTKSETLPALGARMKSC